MIRGLIIASCFPFIASAQPANNNTEGKVNNVVSKFEAITGKEPNYKDSLERAKVKIKNLNGVVATQADSIGWLTEELIRMDRQYILAKYSNYNPDVKYDKKQYDDFKSSAFIRSVIGKEDGFSVFFPFKESNTEFEKYTELNQLANELKENKKLKIYLNGYSDKLGMESENLKVSNLRAESVKNYLVTKLGIDTDKIVTQAYGDKGDNRFKEDDVDFLNRRVAVEIR